MRSVQSGRQAGWLLFLLLPFLSLLGVHVLVPLYFTLSTVPLLQEAYNSQRTTLEHHNVRSFTEINEQIITAQLNKYYQVFKTLQYLLDSAPHDLSALQRVAAQLNNAYLFAQANPANSSVFQPVSMWFAPNSTQLGQLGPGQFEALITYAGVEPYLRALLGGWESSALLGVTTCVLTYQGTISFEFPSRFQDEFADLAASGESPYLLPTLNNFAISNQTVSAYVEINGGTSRLLFCSVLTDGDGMAFGSSCLNLDLQILGHQIGQAISFVPSSFTSTTYSLLLPVGPDLFLSIYRFGVDSAQALNATPVSADYLSQHLQLTSADHTFIARKGQTTLVFGPVLLLDASQKENRALFFMTENRFLPSVIGKEQFNRSIDIFVGPVVSLIVLSALASWWVLRRLLSGLQDELVDVEGRCRLILQGDLHMTVPPHEGSKDVREVTDAVRVINLLHRLSHSPHFQGHPVTKVLAYSHALHSLRQLNYDTAAALQNIGDCYLRMGESEKAVGCLKQSVRLALTVIQSQHGSLDLMLQRKRQGRVSVDYRFLELVLIRRLFHLLLAQRTWLQQYPINLSEQITKQLSWRRNTLMLEMPREKGSAGWRAAIVRQTLQYVLMLKKAIYPDFSIYAQCVLALLWEVKLLLEQGQLLLASALLQRAERVAQLYCESFIEVGRKLHQKGSRYKLFHSRNRISPHSRTHPDVVRTLCAQVRAQLLLATATSPFSNHYVALELLLDSAKTSVFSPKIISENMQIARNLLQQLDCKTDSLETTQIYRQSMPYKCLIDGGEGREFVFLVDCGPRKSRGQGRASRAAHVFDRLVKGRDRVSIVKFHSKQGVKLQCSLTFKEAQEAMLRRELQRSFHEQSTRKSDPSEFFQAIQRSLYRVRRLRSEKILMIFCRRLTDYSNTKQRKGVHFQDIGPEIAELLQESGIQHCKICVVGSEGDKVEDIRCFFGLEKVNELAWRERNMGDNVVYVMGAGHRSDLDRVLGEKEMQAPPDNHIFLL